MIPRETTCQEKELLGRFYPKRYHAYGPYAISFRGNKDWRDDEAVALERTSEPSSSLLPSITQCSEAQVGKIGISLEHIF